LTVLVVEGVRQRPVDVDYVYRRGRLTGAILVSDRG
jgi:hypothetical protein